MNCISSPITNMLLIVIVGVWSSCSQPKEAKRGENPEVEEILDSATIRSENTYQIYCSGCHGEQMFAFVDRKWKHGNTKDSLIQSIANGYTDAGMPGWSAAFSKEQISEMADYILSGIDHVEKYGFEEVKIESDTFESEQLTFSLDTVVSGMTNPWGMTFLPSGDLLVTEKSGILYRVDNRGNKTVINGTPKVRNDVQGGLLDIILHPEFEKNNWLYLSYSDYVVEDGDTLSGTAINKYTLINDELTMSLNLFKGIPYSSAKWHYGSRMAFDNEGYLYFTASDRANQKENPQTLKNPKGKIHRMYADGSIPEDNPFIDTLNAVASIYTYGHRNLQGLTYNEETNVMWSHEHGPRGGDEINIVKPGINYGWPVISYGINYDGSTFTNLTEKEGMEQPVHYWTPSIAPCGMTFVDSDKYPEWEGNLLVGSLRFKYLNLCVMEGDKVVSEEILMKNIGRLRNVKQGPDGYIYVAVEDPGFVFRLIPIRHNQ
ncbi:MAG: PQQ-dependent sugar dehydrogenase [Marinoscillum sp.]